MHFSFEMADRSNRVEHSDGRISMIGLVISLVPFQREYESGDSLPLLSMN